MDALGFVSEMKNTIFRLVAAIIHIRDLTFTSSPRNQSVAVHPQDVETLRNASTLLEVRPEDLEMALVTDITYNKGTLVNRARTVNEACAARDALCSDLYQRMFTVIVWKINHHLAVDEELLGESAHKISILDPPGFEILGVNRLEQLCINTLNEQLAHFYNQHIFVWEQDDRQVEGILFHRQDFPDNKVILELLLERPNGIFAEIDEQCKSSKSSDASLVKKLNTKNRQSPGYGANSSVTPCFVVNHYSGKVTYSAANMLNRNKDVLAGSLRKCLQDSSDELISMLFRLRISPSGAIMTAQTDGSPLPPILLKKKHLKKMRATVRRKTEMIGDVHGYSKTPPRKKDVWQDQVHPTLTGQLRYSLSDLLTKTLSSEVHFIKCIKPNMELAPGRFDDELVTTQLRFSGVMETIDMRQQGFPARVAFSVFTDRYKHLAYRFTEVPKPSSDSCETILMKTQSEGWKVGKTKVFMKMRCRNRLDDLLDKTYRRIVTVQKLWRGRQARRLHRQLRYYQLQEERATAIFLSELENQMNIVYSHICNQVSDEDRRTNFSHLELSQQNQEQVKERAMGILQGKARKISRESPPKSSPARSTGSGSEMIKDGVAEESTQVPPPDLSVVDSFDFLNSERNDVINAQASPSDAAPTLLSITDAFGFGPTSSELLSPDSSGHDSTDSPYYDPNSSLSIVDAFSSTPMVEEPGEITPEDFRGLSLVDVFNFSPGVPPEERASADGNGADNNANYLGRPRLTEHDSNLSNLSVASTDSKDSIDDEMDIIARLDPGPWCTITCHERDRPRGEFTVDRPIITVDGSYTTFDVTRIGLGALPMEANDSKVERVRRCIGKGIKLVIDEEGNLWIKRLSKNPVFVKGYFLSEEVMSAKGVLYKDKLAKVFDYSSFEARLQYECKPKRFVPEKVTLVLSSVRVYVIFVIDSDLDVDTPCWLEVVMSEPQRIAEVAVKLAKEKRREEHRKQNERTPPILKAKIGKSRQVIAMGVFEKKIRPGRYVDSFKFGRKDWARKRVAVNPFAYGAHALCKDDEEDDESVAKERSFSSPAEIQHRNSSSVDIGEVLDDVFASEGSDSSDANQLAEMRHRELVLDASVEVNRKTKGFGALEARTKMNYELSSHGKPRSDREAEGKKVWARRKHEHGKRANTTT